MPERTGLPERPATDPTRAAEAEPGQVEPVVRDVTAGRAAGTAWNADMDPTRPAVPADPRR